ncbi:carbonic anhydrase [Mycobacterium sp. ACS1612]|uniref:carbonic anhydrase n=1 Tax=Mycobacterium sp. ACS1612 TaxID=1834117 RepID=UPI0007FBD7FA|nr:carbonic anhydrase [Mycobacterium sp. ACS1612]OBF33845.1 carbonic anhydrase [Mycobacterium sp. ACS1612]
MTLSREHSRRNLLLAAATGAGALAVSSCSAPAKGGATAKAAVEPLATDPDHALQLLTEGNRRFVDNHAEHVDDSLARRMAVRTSQRPFATILSCVDSRVPVELVFDRGFGDLVVVRSAGEVLDHSVIGSLEFGAAELNTPLLMVLGHQRCGALTAAVDAFDKKSTEQGDLGYLVEALAPAVRQVSGQPGDRVTNAVRANVTLTLAQLRRSPLLGQLEKQGKLKMVGGYYALDTGKVDMI